MTLLDIDGKEKTDLLKGIFKQNQELLEDNKKLRVLLETQNNKIEIINSRLEALEHRLVRSKSHDEELILLNPAHKPEKKIKLDESLPPKTSSINMILIKKDPQIRVLLGKDEKLALLAINDKHCRNWKLNKSLRIQDLQCLLPGEPISLLVKRLQNY